MLCEYRKLVVYHTHIPQNLLPDNNFHVEITSLNFGNRRILMNQQGVLPNKAIHVFLQIPRKNVQLPILTIGNAASYCVQSTDRPRHNQIEMGIVNFQHFFIVRNTSSSLESDC